MMKSLLIFLFVFISHSAFSQIDLVSVVTIPPSPGSSHSLSLAGAKFNTPTCATWWYLGEDQGHWSKPYGNYESIDSGITWNGLFDSGHDNTNSPWGIISLYYDSYGDTIIGASTGWPVSWFCKLTRSVDCGVTWTDHFYTSYLNLPNVLSIYNGRNGYGVNSYGQIIRIDRDSSFKLNSFIPTNFNSFYGFKFISDSTGFILTRDTIYRSLNGGMTWLPILSDTLGQFGEWNFINDSTIIISKGNYGNYYRSNNYGTTWTQYVYPVPIYNIFSFHPDSLFGIYTPGSAYHDPNGYSYIMRSYDGGTSWDSIPFLTGYLVYNMKIFDRSLGYVMAGKAYPDEANYIFHIHYNLVSVEDMSVMNNVYVYPNPFSNEFKISGWSSGTMQLFDACGRLVYESKINQDNQNFEVDIPKGFYLLKLVDGNKQRVLRLIH